MQFISYIVVIFLLATQGKALSGEEDATFDWKLAKAVLTKECQICNVITSPLSIKLLLSLTSNAINPVSLSRKELSILFPKLNTDQINKYWHKIINTFDSSETVSIASQLCVDKSVKIDSTSNFENIAKNDYAAVIKSLDLQDTEKSAEEINNYVYENTKHNIKNFIEPDNLEDVSVMLLNVLYFESGWETTFDPSETKYKTFYVAPGKEIQVPMMHKFEWHYDTSSSKELNSEIIRLYYQDWQYAMYIILPNERYGLQSVIDKLDKVDMSNLGYVFSTKTNLQIPKFKFDSNLQLKEHLKTIGVKTIFTQDSNIESLVSGSSLSVSNIVQKSGIFVNETGSVAFSASGEDFGNKSGFDKTIDFVVDHPFMFFIKNENNGAILYAGKVMEPSFE